MTGKSSSTTLFPPERTAILSSSHHDVLDLTDVPLIGQGTKRRVFHHPGDPSCCIKIVRPDLKNWTRPFQGWKRYFYRSGAHSMQIDELREQFALYALGGYPDFMTPIRGLLETNLGPGLVVGIVRDDDGTLAPDVRQMILRKTFNPAAEQAVEDFFRKVLAASIVVSDLTPQNICCARRGDGYACFMVDGWGDDSLLKLKSFSTGINTLLKRFAIAQCRSKMRNYQALVAKGAIDENTGAQPV